MFQTILKVIEFIDAHSWIVTFFAGCTIFVLYQKRKNDNKRDAAKLILQEIRYADQKVRNYRTYSSYNFAEKILPTNSWNKNISFFIRELTESELDIISKFFSSASYLDEVISAISKEKNRTLISPNAPVDIENSSVPIATGTGGLTEDEPAKRLIETISKDIESIHNTPAADKLRVISEKKTLYFL
ncbi:hypothetical protein A3C87_03805 [Candidatus Kaiserbacteria bacterium RIFCSPHIGHO2_02_FULL_49_34]|uniref:Uncharacterized protein n=1 Tax=Candidatus Kaiserbacteria bacterium RIFCSPHIGHO2_02_FULL_49_34 TaxID=1798491 RepID=A0A1F6DJV2_9BACT|nr:MAG: hypothetical protein A3C87_03805 [Candidatus Kaiserbacteria bacterium RIFCSPHIGHO2_02_FULL_49_34]